MASCITEQWSGSVCPQARLIVTESSSTAATSTLSWTLEYVAHGYEARTNGILRNWSVTINGSQVASGQYNIDHVTNVRTIRTGTVTINKTSAYQSISFSLSFQFDLTWSGRFGGTKTATGSIGISARPSYTISYNANGGSGAPSSQTKWAGDTIYLSQACPSRVGHTFKGWSTSNDNTVDYYAGSAYSANASVTLYAVWQIHTYTISYNANGGSGAPSSQTKTYGRELILSGNKPIRTNYNFLGWGTSSSSTSVSYSPGSVYRSDYDITLYAIWQLAYVKPRIWGVSVDRCKSDGTLSEEGTYAKVRCSWSTDRNVTNIILYHKKESDGNWISTKVNGSGTSGTIDTIIGGSLSTEFVYNVSIRVQDSVDLTDVYYDLAAMSFIIDVPASGDGIAFGKPAQTSGTMDIGYDLLIRKNLKASVGGNIVIPFNFYQSGVEIMKTLWVKERIVKESAWASSWIGARNKAMITNTGVAKNDGAFYPLLSTKTQNGSWNIGVLNESLAFSYDKDSDYNMNNNKSTVRWLYSDGTMDNMEGYMVEAEHLKHSPLSGSYGFQIASAGWSGSHDKYFIGVNSNDELHIGTQLNGASTIRVTKMAKHASIQSKTYVVNPGGKDWVFLENISGGNLTGAISNGDQNALEKQVTCIGHGNELRAHLSSAHSGAIRVNVCPFTSA